MIVQGTAKSGGEEMRKTAISLVGLLALPIGVTVSAEPALQKGTKDMSLMGSPDFTAPTGDTLNLDIGFGIFLKDKFNLIPITES